MHGQTERTLKLTRHRLAKACLRRGADINGQNHTGNTPLHFAFAYGFDKLGDYLISKGADPGVRNTSGLTPYEGLGGRGKRK